MLSQRQKEFKGCGPCQIPCPPMGGEPATSALPRTKIPRKNCLVDRAGIEPAISALQMRHSTTKLPALNFSAGLYARGALPTKLTTRCSKCAQCSGKTQPCPHRRITPLQASRKKKMAETWFWPAKTNTPALSKCRSYSIIEWEETRKCFRWGHI